MVYYHEIALRSRLTIHLPDRYLQQGYILDPRQPDSLGQGISLVKKFDCPGEPSIVIKKLRDTLDKDKALMVLRELNLLRSMRHPNIVRLVDKFAVSNNHLEPSRVPETMHSIYHITLYCGVPLSSVIDKGDYKMEQVKSWLREFLSALQYIHSLGISHRGLNPESLCIDASADRKLTVLGFGNARVLDKSNNTQKRGDSDFYMALEMQFKMKQSYDEMVDIWSMAVILCELLTGKMLFTGRDGKTDSVKNVVKLMVEYCGTIDAMVIDQIEDINNRKALAAMQKERKDFREFLRADVGSGRGIRPHDIDDEPDLRSFIDRTLQHNPKARMSADEALCHPFVFPRELPKEPEKKKGQDEKVLTALLENILEEIKAPMGNN